MRDYESLDVAIIEELNRSPSTFSALHSVFSIHNLTRLHSEQSWKPRKGYTESFRFLDRRLQALRKKGQIAFIDGKWRILPLRIAAS